MPSELIELRMRIKCARQKLEWELREIDEYVDQVENKLNKSEGFLIS